MAQPTKRHKVIKADNLGIKGSGEGLKLCNNCPFFSFTDVGNVRSYICNPNDKVLDKSDTSIEKEVSVPRWCGNRKKGIIGKIFDRL